MTASDELFSAASRSFSSAFGGVIRLEPDGAPPLWIDGRTDRPQISHGAPQGDDPAGQCVWRASRDTLIRILEGERLLGGSYVSGRLTIAGDMSVMARLSLEPAGRG